MTLGKGSLGKPETAFCDDGPPEPRQSSDVLETALVGGAARADRHEGVRRKRPGVDDCC
jgi:hypothetical protein